MRQGELEELTLTQKFWFSKEHSRKKKAHLIPLICSFCNFLPPTSQITQIRTASYDFKKHNIPKWTGKLQQTEYSFQLVYPTDAMEWCCEQDHVIYELSQACSVLPLVFTDGENHSVSFNKFSLFTYHLLGMGQGVTKSDLISASQHSLTAEEEKQ